MYGSRGDVAFGWGEDKAAAANKTPTAQANKWGGRWGNKQGDKAAAADKTPITAGSVSMREAGFWKDYAGTPLLALGNSSFSLLYRDFRG